MIIDCVSDLHGYQPELDGGDLLIVAGDCTSRDKKEEWGEFFKWLHAQEYEKKILVGGNHDGGLVNVRPFVDKTIEYLFDSGTEFKKMRIWGSPWINRFPGINPLCTAFSRPCGLSLKDRWDLVPSGTDIIITHVPPLGVLDEIEEESLGDEWLGEAIEDVFPKLHVFGHIHECGGKREIHNRMDGNIVYVNAAYVDRAYEPVHEPVRILL